MEKCHPLQEGLARPERSESSPLAPQRRPPSPAPGHAPESPTDPSFTPGRGGGSVLPLVLLGSGYGGARAAEVVVIALRPGTGRPLGAPSPDPAGLPVPPTLCGGMTGAVGDRPAPGRTRSSSVGAAWRAQIPRGWARSCVSAGIHDRGRRRSKTRLGVRAPCILTQRPSWPFLRDSSSPDVILHRSARPPPAPRSERREPPRKRGRFLG